MHKQVVCAGEIGDVRRLRRQNRRQNDEAVILEGQSIQPMFGRLILVCSLSVSELYEMVLCSGSLGHNVRSNVIHEGQSVTPATHCALVESVSGSIPSY